MTIQLICVGKLKERYLKQACEEYIKRLKPYTKLQIIEIPEGNSSLPPALILREEGKNILHHLSKNTYAIALVIEGKRMSSLQFAQKLDELITYGQSHISFIIGGSYGLDQTVLEQADFKLSFSLMTFPHQLFRVMLLEQIYRAHKIIRGEAYHK